MLLREFQVAPCEEALQYITGHNLRRTLHFVIWSSIAGIRNMAPYPWTKVHGNDLIARMFRHIYVLDLNINGRFQSCKCVCNLLTGTVCYLLPNYLQRLGRYTDDEPTTISIQKGTGSMHPILQFSRRLFQFQNTGFVCCYDRLYIVNCHTLISIYSTIPNSLRYTLISLSAQDTKQSQNDQRNCTENPCAKRFGEKLFSDVSL